MKEILRTKRLEVTQYYLLGYTYEEVEEEAGVSHGSLANIAREIENGKLTIPGTPIVRLNTSSKPHLGTLTASSKSRFS